jgi:hypothetical protein
MNYNHRYHQIKCTKCYFASFRTNIPDKCPKCNGPIRTYEKLPSEKPCFNCGATITKTATERGFYWHAKKYCDKCNSITDMPNKPYVQLEMRPKRRQRPLKTHKLVCGCIKLGLKNSFCMNYPCTCRNLAHYHPKKPVSKAFAL